MRSPYVQFEPLKRVPNFECDSLSYRRFLANYVAKNDKVVTLSLNFFSLLKGLFKSRMKKVVRNMYTICDDNHDDFYNQPY